MNIIKEDYRTKEIQAFTMSISKNGLLGLFCGPYNILLLTLDDTKNKRKAPINKSLDPMSCQFNKMSNENFAITLNNVCKLYDIELNKIQALKAHTKSITSIDWHPIQVNHIATASLDNFKSLCIWDLRNSKNPTQRIDTSGVNQVKWNKTKAHLLGTTINSEIRIWDDRKLSLPINVLAAHTDLVNDFDWHCDDENVLLSCGQDKKIKIWNFLEGYSRPMIEFEDDFSFSHARFDSLGNIVTLSASDVSSDNQVAYWDYTDFHKVCATPSSVNTITTFDWKRETFDSYEFVTLHRNSDFKIWQLDKAACFAKRRRGASYMTSFENSMSNDRLFLSPSPDYSFTHSTNVIAELPSAKVAIAYQRDLTSTIMSHHSDPNLIMRERQNRLLFDDQEMRYRELDRLISTNQVTYDKNFETKSVIANFTLLNIKCSIQFIYRSSLGDSVFLDVIILPGRSEKIRPQNLEELEKILKATVDDCRTNSVPPIEKCIDVAMDYLNKLSSRFSLRAIRSLKEQLNPTANSYCNLPDMRVPFPRICGAKFSPSGLLVCFVAPPGYMARFHGIPRSLADIVKQSNISSTGKGFFYDYKTLAIGKNASQKQYTKTTSVRKLRAADFNMDSTARKLSSHSIATQKMMHLVVIYNAVQLSLFSPHLARKYSVSVGNVEAMCQHNCTVVADLNRKDLIEFWKYCVMLANGCRSSYNLFGSQIKPWASQSMGRNMCEKWLDHFIKFSDIQSAAMLILVMRAIDTDLESFIESKYNLSSIPVVNSSRRNVSQESLMDSIHPDNMTIHFPMQNYYAYYPTAISDVGSRNTIPGPGRFRTNSFGEYEIGNTKKSDSLSDVLLLHKEHSKLIDPSRLRKYNEILLHYVHMLTAQNLLSVAAKIVQKIMPVAFTNYFSCSYNFSVLLLRNCVQDHRCRSVYIDEARSTVICSDCSTRNLSIHTQDLNIKSSIVCSVCRLHVRGIFSVCPQCNHGGHVSHLISWFSRSGSLAVCPTGCGCACLSAKDVIPDNPSLVFAN